MISVLLTSSPLMPMASALTSVAFSTNADNGALMPMLCTS